MLSTLRKAACIGKLGEKIHLGGQGGGGGVVVSVCAMLAQLVRSLTASQKVPGSIPGLAMVLNI